MHQRNTILGLDLGTNSIGWAVIDGKKNKIQDCGVNVFPEGVNLENGRESSKNETRRKVRGARRQQFRRKIRRKLLRDLLQKNEMMPPEKEAIREWFKLNPYEFRKIALDEKISLQELGRIFYHLSQRRGFKSNRKAGDAKEESAIFKGKDGKTGIDDTRQGMENHHSLGEYLNSLNPHQERIRNRYTTRQMYVEEFLSIWTKQADYHPELTRELMQEIGGKFHKDEDGKIKLKKEGIIFHQRPLKSQKYLIGKCSFEPTKRRAPASCIPFEKFRAWQWSHTVECDGKKLSKEQRQKVVDYLLSVDKPAFETIVKKALKLNPGDHIFNYQEPEGKEVKIVGSTVIRKLNDIFKDWKQKSDKEQEDIWHVLFSATDNDWLEKYAKEKWQLNEKSIETIKKLTFDSKYANLSRNAINKILEFLPDHPYHQAVALAGVKNAMGEKGEKGEKCWKNLNPDKRNSLKQEVVDMVGSDTAGGYLDKLKRHLRRNHGLDEKRLQKLYHHSVIKEEEIRDRLPRGEAADREIQNLRNPMVSQALFELRKLVNSLLKKHGSFTEIKVELARDLKNSKKRRDEIKKDQNRRERENDRVKEELERYGQCIRINHENILKYKLWEECRHICPYTGKPIGVEKLFSGEIQIEHIVPWSRSLNDSYLNKTLCYADENRNKGNRTPYEFYRSDEWDKVKTRVSNLFRTSMDKYNRFIQEKGSDKGPVNRQVVQQVMDKASELFGKSDQFPDCQKKFKEFVEKETGDGNSINRQLWNKVKKKALSSFSPCSKLPSYITGYKKFERFVKEKVDDSDFISRQLNDTRYISRQAKDYLKKICPKISVNPGQMTAHIRHHWGLNTILSDSAVKDRSDHRHHAIDAMVIACLRQEHLQQLAERNRYQRNHDDESINRPWTDFWPDAKDAIEQILVSHRKVSRVLSARTHKTKKNGREYQNIGIAARGQLHKESNYGRRRNPETKKEGFHIRKPLTALTPAMFPKIVDKNIRELAEERLKDVPMKNGKYDEKSEAFKTVFSKPLDFKDKNDDKWRPPIRKVRIAENSTGIVQLKEDVNRWVEPGDNHHVLIYRNKKGELAEKVVTFLEAVRRKRDGKALFQLPEDGIEIVTTLQRDDMFLLNLNENDIDWDDKRILQPHLYRVQKLSAGDYYFRLATASTLKRQDESWTIKGFGEGKTGWLRANPIKVDLTVDGTIRPGYEKR